MKHLVLVVGISLFSLSAWSIDRDVTLNQDGGSVLFTLTSTSPSASNSLSKPFFGDLPIVFTYSQPAREQCPTTFSYFVKTNGHYLTTWNLGLNWGGSGTYNYQEGTSTENIGGSLSYNAQSITVNYGKYYESGTGTLGSMYNRVFDFGAVNKTYTNVLTPSFSVTKVGDSGCGSNLMCMAWADCEIVLETSGTASENVSTTPVNINLQFDMDYSYSKVERINSF